MMSNICCGRETFEDSDYIERCAESSLPTEDCVALRAREEEEEKERERMRERMEKKRKRMDPEAIIKVTTDLCSVMDQLGDSNKAKLSGREKRKLSSAMSAVIKVPVNYSRTCSICGYVNGKITVNGERMYQASHRVDKVPFDVCYFCWDEINFDDSYTVIKCHNDCIPC